MHEETVNTNITVVFGRRRCYNRSCVAIVIVIVLVVSDLMFCYYCLFQSSPFFFSFDARHLDNRSISF